MNMKR